MEISKRYIILVLLFVGTFRVAAQKLSLEEILATIEHNNPQLKMYDADIKSMDAAAEGAKTWMAPQVSTGFFMTPYDMKMWKPNEMNPGMGFYMVGVTQMFPNSGKLKADYNYMRAMSSVEKENKAYTLNQLKAMAKANYYEWLIANKKLKVGNDNLLLMQYMIKSMEIRYQYNMEKLPDYYKAKSQYGKLQAMLAMLENDREQKKIMLNTLMARDKERSLEIDSTFELPETDILWSDTTALAENRSDLKALDKTLAINQLRIAAEKKKLAPEIGLRYEHMFAFGQDPDQFTLMLMINIPFAPWSSRMSKANMESYRLKNESLKFQRQMVLNEATGMISGMAVELKRLKEQYEITEKQVLPALRRNYDTAVIAWQNNTADLFIVIDAWEALNMTQMDSLDKLKAILLTQVELEKQLEKSN